MATKQKSSLARHLTTVTLFSKTIAFILFILLPFIGFYFGIEYQKTIDSVTMSAPTMIPQLQAK